MRMGLGLRQEMSLSQKQTQTVNLSQDQRLELKQLLSLQQTLETQPPPEAIRGLGGMIEADELLKDKGRAGLLIGSIARDIWDKRKTVYDLDARKDVDVLVLDTDTPLHEPFAGGIDWWTTHERRFERITSRHGTVLNNVNVRWHENGYGVVLRFIARPQYRDAKIVTSGLYIPSRDLATKLRATEIRALATFQHREVDTEVDEALEQSLHRGLSPRLMPELSSFKDRVIGAGVHAIDPDYYQAIRSAK